MSAPTNTPFTRPPQVNWLAVLKALGYVIPLLVAVAMLYLSSVFARHEQVKEAVAPYASLPNRVDKLEDFKTEQRAVQQTTTSAVGAIQQDISGLKAKLDALQTESTRNTDRILQRLDRVAPPRYGSEPPP